MYFMVETVTRMNFVKRKYIIKYRIVLSFFGKFIIFRFKIQTIRKVKATVNDWRKTKREERRIFTPI